MHKVKYALSYPLQVGLIMGFNFLIFFKIISDDEVENLIQKTANESIFKPIMLLADLMDEAAKKEGFHLSDKTEKNKLLEAYRRYTAILVIELCSKTIWNKSLAIKISNKILKELFRKLSWQFRCLGLEFSPEVPSI